jgi:ATP-dependent Clp protease ATP-binding subunit ClpB
VDVVRGHFRPEFANRLDEIICSTAWRWSTCGSIVDIQVGRVQKLLRTAKITLDV